MGAHAIYLPDDYPPDDAVVSRFWNEQYLASRAFLLAD